MKSLFIFHRDFRCHDNTSLIKACSESNEVYPIFIFTKEQIDPKKNKYFSNNSVQFLVESLEDLNKQCSNKLAIFYDDDQLTCVKKLVKNNDINAIYTNMDLTPYAVKRETQLENFCQKNDLEFHMFEDYTMLPVKSVLTDSGECYQKYTPYLRKAIKQSVPKDTGFTKTMLNKLKRIEKTNINPRKFYKENPDIAVRGGRENALKILNSLDKHKQYDKKRDCLDYQTTLLSAYLKNGCVSIRETYHRMVQMLGKSNGLIKQLFWREFYYNVAYCYPHSIGRSLKPKYDNLKWDKNYEYLKKWKEGNTGFPIVDAGMRQMNKTGFMHNRCRMIVSNFLIKVLLQNWIEGERYFATQLVDYDVINNNAGWGWSQGGHTDSQPYFRVFNPWLQSKKFDPNGEYIRKWVPELKDVPISDLHKPNSKSIVDYGTQKEKAMKMYKAIF